MKKAFTFFASLLLCLTVSAQIPQGISYQAVVRDAQGKLVSNSNIGIRVSIIQGSAEGTVVYAETHNILSNTNGLVTYVIGKGVLLEGVFEEIDWSQAPYFLKTEVDPTGGTNYSIEGTTQFHSVPYAFHSQTSNVAKSIDGSVSSNIKAPAVALSPATDVQQFSAILNGVVNGEGFLTNVMFEWGTTTSYGNTIEAVQSSVRGSIDVSVTAHLSNLSSGTTYHYRIKASNAVDLVYSEGLSFTTEMSAPQISTNAITSITPYSAISGGNITHDGGLPVTARGVIWSTSENPTIESNDGITNDGAGSGSFVSEIDGLPPNTTYYVRAYATNDNGTASGNQRSFTTLGQVPTVSTSPASGITNTDAILYGVVNANHLETTVVFEYGLTTEYGSTITATQSPFTGSSNTNVSAAIDGLTLGTTYYYRVKAENELGISYGEPQSFKTTITGITSTVTDSEGNVYNTIGIGQQEWMAEDLRYLPTIVGPGTGSNTEPYYYVYGYDGTDVEDAKATDNFANYGVLYNWPAVVQTGGNAICPTGWIVPSDAEWTTLTNYVGTNPGSKLKSARTAIGDPPVGISTNDHPRWNYHADNYGTDNYNFSALPGGYWTTSGSFNFLGSSGYWWSATEDSSSSAWFRSLGSSDAGVGRGGTGKGFGFSVRCVKDVD